MPILLHEQSDQIAHQGFVIGNQDDSLACCLRPELRGID